MSWLFGRQAELQAKLDKSYGDAWLEHRNAYDRSQNEAIDKAVEFKRANKGKELTEWQRMVLQGYQVEATIHDRLAYQYGHKLGLE